MRLLLTIVFVLGACAPALAAGGPVPPVQGGTGVSAPGGPDNLVAVPAGRRTVVLRIDKADGSVLRSRSLAGYWGVPGATWDGVNTGVSGDGRTLVLAGGSVKRTQLRVLNALTLHPQRHIVLPGYFTVDAISPDGRWLYLIDYKNANASKYDVRAYDLRRGRMLARTIVDPREPEEKLDGVPVTRVQSPDGRWAYTLYVAGQPFIHALDTAGRTAVCIDVPKALSGQLTDAKLALHGTTLDVAEQGRPLVTVDLRSFKASEPAAAAPPPPPAATPRPAAHNGGGGSWALWLIPAAVLAALGLVALRRRLPSSGEWSTSSRA